MTCTGLSMRYGRVAALEKVDFSLMQGEIHGVVGTNGAGKSTLLKILAGALPEYEGQITVGGLPVRLGSPQAARGLGIAMVYQELSSIGQLSVAENLFLGRQKTGRFGQIDWRGMELQARAHLADLGIELDVRRRLEEFPLVVRQMVEIARGIHSGARILILDEPTSALSPPEAARLFSMMRRLRETGVTMVFVSHFLDDVLAICDRVTILKDGERVATREAKNVDKHEVIHCMLAHGLEGLEIGYERGRLLPPRCATPARLMVRGLTRKGAFEDVSLAVAPGECLALYGFVGAGHQELAQALAGAIGTTQGEILVDGARLDGRRTDAFIRKGVVLVSGDRARMLVPSAQVYKNVSLGNLHRLGRAWLSSRREVANCRRMLDRVACRPADPWLLPVQLSGGNQQKTVLARWLGTPLQVLVLDEPTRGMDVAAKEEVMALVRRLKEGGTAIVLATTEPELALAHADRIVVMRRGKIEREFAEIEVDKGALLRSS